MLHVTDDITGQSVETDEYDFLAAVSPWFPDAPVGVERMLSELADLVTRPVWPEKVAQFESLFDITITRKEERN